MGISKNLILMSLSKHIHLKILYKSASKARCYENCLTANVGFLRIALTLLDYKPPLKLRRAKAERAGFEPAIPLQVYTLSRRARSTTLTPLQGDL
jgi:hypothetical protein